MIPLVMSIIAKTETFQRDMARARGHVGKFGNQIKTTSTVMSGLSKQFLVFAGAGGAIYKLESVLKDSVTTFAEFEKGMANVSTILNNQSRALLPYYSSQIRQMSTEFGESTEVLSKGLYDIVSASIAPSKAMKVLEVSVKAAKAGISETSVAADAITTILNSYGYEAEKAAQVSDILFTTIRKGKTTFGELAPNIGKVTSLAATAGLSFEELSASIATMTRAGVQSEIAITSLRALILAFLSPQKDSIEAARKYGVELNSNTLKVEGLTGVIRKLEKATAEELAIIIPTSRAIAGFAASLKDAAGNAEDLNDMLNAAGANEEALTEIQKTLNYELDRTVQYWKDFKRTIGDEVAPILNKLLPILNKTISYLDEIAGFIMAGTDVNAMTQVYIKAAAERERRKKDLEAFFKEQEKDILKTSTEKPFGGYEYLTIPETEPVRPSEEQWKKYQEAAAKTKEDAAQSAYDQAAAYARMYDAIDSKSKESYAAREDLIEKEYELYKLKADDTVLVEKLKQERITQLRMEEALVRGDILKGIGVALYEIKQETPSIGKIFHDITLELNSGLVDGLNDALWKTKELDEAMKELGRSMAQMATKMLLQMAVSNAMTGLGSFLNLPFMHEGGEVGKAGFQLKAVPASAFTNAPRLHSGLASDEFPAVLQRGERVYSKGSNKNMESLLGEILGALRQRQTIQANIIDRRDVVTKERMEGRDGESWTMGHLQRNS